MADSYLRMEIAARVLEESQKIPAADGDARTQVESAANAYYGQVLSGIRTRLLGYFPDATTAQKTFGDFIDRFTAATSGKDPAALESLAGVLGVEPPPADAEQFRAALMNGRLEADVAAAGKFLGDVQSWLRLRGKGEMPPLSAWLNRDGSAAVAAGGAESPRPKRRRKANALRDSEAAAGIFVEAEDDGASSLRSFGMKRKERRYKAHETAQKELEQVAAERQVADEEANAKKLAAAQAEAAALQAQAQRIAAAEQQAIVQDQNSWKTRLKGVLTVAIGAAGGAFAGGVGSRAGEAAANAVFNSGML